MQLVVPKEGLRAPLFFTFCWLALADQATAQSVSQQDLQRCAQLQTTELKLACFEALVAPSAELAAQPSTEPGSPEQSAVHQAEPAELPELDPQSNSTPAPTVTAAAATAATVASIESSASASAEPEPAAGAAAPNTYEQDQAGPEVAAATSSQANAAGGAYVDEPKAQEESDDEKESDDEILIATVNKVVRGDGRRLIFYFENGQVWRQNKSDYLTYPKNEPFEVEVTKGMMGDYRLRVGGEGRMSRIKRIE